jgi:hypothetical protein
MSVEQALSSERLPDTLEQMWLSLVRRPWRTVTVVPTAPALSARPSVNALAMIAGSYHLGEFEFVDATRFTLAEASQRVAELRPVQPAGVRRVFAVEYPVEGSGAMPLALASDGILLVVALGVTRADHAQAIIDMVGRERVFGAVALHGDAARLDVSSEMWSNASSPPIRTARDG